MLQGKVVLIVFLPDLVRPVGAFAMPGRSFFFLGNDTTNQEYQCEGELQKFDTCLSDRTRNAIRRGELE